MADPNPSAARDVDAAALADRLRPMLLKLSRHLRREAQNVGVSPLDAQLLGLIMQRPGAGVSELAEIEQVSRPAMSVHVKRLAAAGWLTRDGDERHHDRRRVRLALSAEGRQALAVVRRSRNDWLEARLARLGADERAALEGALAPFARLVAMKP